MSFNLTPKLVFFCSWGILLLVLLGACERPVNETPPPDDTASEASPTPDGLQIFKSPSLPSSPSRIVSLAPNVTEILFALGAGDRLVGATRYCDYPQAANDVPRVGGMLDPDFEAILAARPELVTGVMDGSDRRLVARLDQANIPYVFFKMDTIEDTAAGILAIGRHIGLAEEGDRVSTELDRALNAVSSRSKSAVAAGGQSPTVLLVYDHQPVVVAGPGTFGHELIALSGARNALADDARAYPVLDIEMVLRLNPDVIVDATLSRSDDEVARFWAQYPTLEAVKADRVARFGDPVLMRPGPRLAKALELISAAVAP
jgi:iron complex transport system substrate-binding protein